MKAVMGFQKITVFFLFYCINSSLAVKPQVDILSSHGALNTLEEDEILRVFSQNKTSDSSENFTFVELVSTLKNHSSSHLLMLQKQLDAAENNHHNYYDEFKEEIDHEARKLLQIIPPYNPGYGGVSEECRKHSDIYLKELSKFTLWALKMYDANAKMPSGLLNGNVNQLGDFDECVGVEDTKHEIRGQYCLAYLSLEVEQSRTDLKYLHKLLHSHYAFRSNVTDPGHRVPRFSSVNWAVCTPAACSAKDVQISFQETLNKHISGTGLNISVHVDPEMCHYKETEPIPKETVIVGLFFVGIIALSVIAGLYDHYNIHTNEILLSFSLKRNFLKLISLKRNEGDIEALHGIRALNAFMLVLAHKSMALFFNPYVNRTDMTEILGQPWTVIGRAASLYTDPFIMLSGLLTTYSFVGRLKKTGNIDIKSEYISRLLRLVPTLGALILFCTYVMPFIGSGPQWNLVVTHHAAICKKTWWRNFLFIHNYFGFENMCLTHTHHLGIDTQLFAISPLLVILLYKKPKIGTIILSIIALISTMLRYFVTYHLQLNNYVFFGTSIRQLFDTANFSYILPSHRLTVYIMGISVGYLLRKVPKGYKINTGLINFGWIISTIMFLAAFLGPAKMGSMHYIYNPLHAATYNAFAPIGWCTLFAWTAFLYHTGNTNGWLSKFFSWKGFLISTRLSYSIYLTQFPVFFYNVGRTRNAQHYEFFSMLFNLNEFFWIIATSVVLTLLFDTPFQNIKNHLMSKKQSSSKPAKCNSTDSTLKSNKIE